MQLNNRRPKTHTSHFCIRDSAHSPGFKFGAFVIASKNSFRMLFLCCAFIFMIAHPSGYLSAMDSKSNWSGLAISDLNAIRTWIASSHPGFIDHHNTQFSRWYQSGFEETMSLASEAKSREDVLALLRYYVTGFEDNHLSVRDPSLDGARVQWAGWSVKPVDDKFIVFNVDGSRTGMPPLGAELLMCNGMSPLEFITQKLSPYIDRRLDLASAQARNANFLSVRSDAFPTLDNAQPSLCRFQNQNHQILDVDIQWRSFPSRATLAPVKFSLQPFMGNGAWIRIPTFQMTPVEHTEMLSILEKRPVSLGPGPLVLDVRGNTGGNSEIGNEILLSLVGDRPQRKQAKAVAQWRVSELAAQTLGMHAEQALKMFGANHESTGIITELYQQVQEALLSGRDWVTQPDDPIAAAQAPNMTGFQGKIVVIIDSSCASACLDFLDSVRLFENVVLIGQQTDADTDYLDSAQVKLPSGNLLNIPLKVWRGRSRKTNEPIFPDLPFAAGLDDDDRLKRWVAKTVLSGH